MKTATASAPVSKTLWIGAAAGIAGGLAEIAWISGFMGVVGGDVGRVASEVAATVAPSLGTASGAVALGLIVHMGLALGLGLLVATLLRRIFPQLVGTWTEAGLLVVALAGVWAINFFVVLPVMNPAFVHIVPLSVSFVSKILFGVAAAAVLWFSARRRA